MVWDFLPPTSCVIYSFGDRVKNNQWSSSVASPSPLLPTFYYLLNWFSVGLVTYGVCHSDGDILRLLIIALYTILAGKIVSFVPDHCVEGAHWPIRNLVTWKMEDDKEKEGLKKVATIASSSTQAFMDPRKSPLICRGNVIFIWSQKKERSWRANGVFL